MGWPRVVIAGGSIGGLTAGLLLRDLGCTVSIFERASTALEDRGAGIVVLPVTERYLTTDKEKTQRVSIELTDWVYVDRDGEVVSTDPGSYRFAAWSSLYRALLSEFGRKDYHFDHEVVDFHQSDDGVSARFGGGRSVEGDLLIFADGFSSTGRSILLPEVRPEYAGYVAWRGTTEESVLSRETRELLRDAMVYQVLSRGHILVYAIPGPGGETSPPERSINFVWYRNYPTGGPFEDLMRDRDGEVHSATMPPGSIRDAHIEEMRTTASSELAPPLLEVVDMCSAPLIQAIFDVFSPRMAFRRTCLIGDAATTLRPHVAAGQAKACADAWALRDALASAGGDVITALEPWEGQQLALARSVIHRTRAMGTASQFDGTMQPGDRHWKFGLWEPGN
jgi:2,6-dihydroxypyridine 3-monooxygenase